MLHLNSSVVPTAPAAGPQPVPCRASARQPTSPPQQDRAELEGFVRAVFADRYGACLRQLMPRLIGMRDVNGRLLAALGLRGAGNGPLFLEQYLDNSIEQILSGLSGNPVVRNQVVELGNLAARHPGSARRMILQQALALHRAGFAWVVFTITPSLVNSFRRLGIGLVCLGPARPERLAPAAREEWGSYYASGPMVYAGNLPLGMPQVRALLGHRDDTVELAA